MKILAVTACPSGVAHTYMSAEAIKVACKKAGIDCKVETQGSIGIEDEIGPDDLKGADAVILTTDMPIKNVERFEGLPKVKVRAGVAIKQADALIAKVSAALKDRA
ncbi:PTS fructose transporter subunit IIB [Olsenella massiliensis]|uniref:PTS fructose transporter subunit IIB n=1 Tax=Olsenella massiliensis TaxID=1622075 RepID=UPI00071D73E1|nr:fructose PTS transporter subunit IIB [Olsenella massiliensis]